MPMPKKNALYEMKRPQDTSPKLQIKLPPYFLHILCTSAAP